MNSLFEVERSLGTTMIQILEINSIYFSIKFTNKITIQFFEQDQLMIKNEYLSLSLFKLKDEYLKN